MSKTVTLQELAERIAWASALLDDGPVKAELDKLSKELSRGDLVVTG
jgi:hypothetical protein